MRFSILFLIVLNLVIVFIEVVNIVFQKKEKKDPDFVLDKHDFVSLAEKTLVELNIQDIIVYQFAQEFSFTPSNYLSIKSKRTYNKIDYVAFLHELGHYYDFKKNDKSMRTILSHHIITISVIVTALTFFFILLALALKISNDIIITLIILNLLVQPIAIFSRAFSEVNANEFVKSYIDSNILVLQVITQITELVYLNVNMILFLFYLYFSRI